MPSIQTAYNWAVATCNNSNVGYDQNYREQQTIDGITYYDCSSFIWYALVAGGWGFTGSAFTTSDMVLVLLNNGWQEVDINGLWVAGDIVWRSGHCEMVFSGSTGYGITMGAHGSTFPLEEQVSINTNPSYANSYTKLLRYTGAEPVQRVWIRDSTNHATFTTEQMQNNALCLRDWFVTNTDWSIQAIAALAGNVEGECGFNPDLIEGNYPIGTVGRDGIGLVQWTTPSGDTENPLFTVMRYLYGETSDWGNPEKQCNCLMAEYGKAIGDIPAVTNPNFDKQWYPRNGYTLTWDEWAHSTSSDMYYLVSVFIEEYLRPANDILEREKTRRTAYANVWFQYFLDNPYSPVTPIASRKGLKVWQMIRYHL